VLLVPSGYHIEQLKYFVVFYCPIMKMSLTGFCEMSYPYHSHCYVMLGRWCEAYCPWAEWPATNRGAAQVRVCSHPVACTDCTAVGYWRWL